MERVGPRKRGGRKEGIPCDEGASESHHVLQHGQEPPGRSVKGVLGVLSGGKVLVGHGVVGHSLGVRRQVRQRMCPESPRLVHGAERQPFVRLGIREVARAAAHV